MQADAEMERAGGPPTRYNQAGEIEKNYSRRMVLLEKVAAPKPRFLGAPNDHFQAIQLTKSALTDIQALYADLEQLVIQARGVPRADGVPVYIAPPDVSLLRWEDIDMVRAEGGWQTISFATMVRGRMDQARTELVVYQDLILGGTVSPWQFLPLAELRDGLTEAVAQELGPLCIRVNDVCPGAVATDLMKKSVKLQAEKLGKSEDEVWKTHYMDAAALRKFVEPKEVAATVLFLACDEASAITGEHLKVDSGRV